MHLSGPVLDPYFLFPPETMDPSTETCDDKNGTPHTRAASTWLWQFRQPGRMRATAEAGGQLSTSWGLAVEVPPGAVLDAAFVGASIISEPDSPVAETRADSSHVRVAAAVSISAVFMDGMPIPAFEAPVAVTLGYADSDVIYVDEATTGADFLSDLWVDLEPYMSLSVELDSSTNLSATVPADLPAGVYTLTVQNPGGQIAQLPGAYTITGPQLTEHIYLPLILREAP